MNIVIFGKRDAMVVIADIHWQVLREHMAKCDKCQSCDTCRTENCHVATLMIECALSPGNSNDPAS